MCKPTEYGVINGRFQPFHLGHLEYANAAYQRSNYLVVGITNPDITHYGNSVANPHRSIAHNNPFTFYERLEMIRDTLLSIGITREKFEIVPFPIDNPVLLDAYIPKGARVFFTVYDVWGYEKIKRVSELGFETEVLWERRPESKVATGFAIRNAIAKGTEWAHFVPKPIYVYIENGGLRRRVRDLFKAEEVDNGATRTADSSS